MLIEPTGFAERPELVPRTLFTRNCLSRNRDVNPSRPLSNCKRRREIRKVHSGASPVINQVALRADRSVHQSPATKVGQIAWGQHSGQSLIADPTGLNGAGAFELTSTTGVHPPPSASDPAHRTFCVVSNGYIATCSEGIPSEPPTIAVMAQKYGTPVCQTIDKTIRSCGIAREYIERAAVHKRVVNIVRSRALDGQPGDNPRLIAALPGNSGRKIIELIGQCNHLSQGSRADLLADVSCIHKMPALGSVRAFIVHPIIVIPTSCLYEVGTIRVSCKSRNGYFVVGMADA